MDDLVQFEEDFNSRTKKWVGSGPVRWLSQTRPIPRSPDGDNKKYKKEGMIRDFATLLLGEFPAREPRLLGDFLMFHLEFTNNSDGPIVPETLRKSKVWHER